MAQTKSNWIWTPEASSRYSRREVLRRATVAGAGATAVAEGLPLIRPARSARAQSSGGELIAGNGADPNSFDPTRMVGLPPRRIGRCIYNALVSIDAEGNVQPELVESWDQPDDRTYVLNLRQGINFHDGTPFNAEAVKFHFDRHLDPEVQSLRAGELSSVEVATIVDDYTVEVALKQPFTPFLAALFDWSGFVVSPTAVAEWGEDYGLHPVGTGPFRFVEYSQDQHTIVERNPEYWEEGLPRVDRIRFRPIPIDSTRLTELRSGGIHIAEDVPLQDVERLTDAPEVVLSVREGFRFDYMHFVSTNEPYGVNKALRQAVNYAIDREALLLGAFFGVGSVGYQPFFPGTPYHDPDFQPYHHDLDRAQALLDESGLSGPIQWQVGMDPDPVKQRVTQLVQEQLGEIGIELQLQQMDDAAYTESVLARSQPFYVGFGWWGWRPDPDQYLSTLMYSESNNNYALLDDPRIDELLASGRAAEGEERIEIYRQLRDIVSEDSYYNYYWEGPNIKGLSPRVVGFEHRPDTIIRYAQISLEA